MGVGTEPITVLVVDDSALFRQSVTAVLRDMPGIEVVGIAKDGVEAIEKMQSLAPELITLDVEMPNMNGIETLREMQRKRIKTRAIMLSSLTEAGAKVTLEALFEGAFDFIQKPVGSMAISRSFLKEALTEKLAAFQSHRAANRSAGAASFQPSSRQNVTTGSTCELVVIGLSTGGPQMLRHVVPRFAPDFPVPIVIVQHMPAKYTKTMADRLDELSELHVVEVSAGMRPAPGNVYVAPGGSHLKIVRQQAHPAFELTQDPPENSCRPAVDFTMRSAAEVYRGGVLAVIMTGMGRDGVVGCQAIARAGGHVFAQDETSSAVYGMPKAVADAGLVDRVLPLGKIAPAITRHVHQSRTAARRTARS